MLDPAQVLGKKAKKLLETCLNRPFFLDLRHVRNADTLPLSKISQSVISCISTPRRASRLEQFHKS